MKIKEFNWGPTLFLTIYQTLLILSLPFYFYFTPPSLGMIGVSIILLYLTGLSITAGYHRFYSHRSYRTNSFVEILLLFFGSMAGQGSALRWSFDHRLHHTHVDTDCDPYSIKKGFWYAHCLWILEKPKKIEAKVVPDLIKNRLVQFQHKYDFLCMLISNGIAFLVVGWFLDDYMGAFFLACWTRLFLLHHFTWFINSLAHTWGDRPFCQEQSAVNNYILALLTFGEGYHNYHHTFCNDYRNGIRWFHFDPTKWLIWTLSKCGLTKELKRMDSYTIQKRMVLERKRLLLGRVCNLWYVKKDELEKLVRELAEKLVVEFAEFNQLRVNYRLARKEGREPDQLKVFKQKLSILRKNLKSNWRLWKQLSRHILKLKPFESFPCPT
ncbi:acyl-CoA desaturase [Candidatus Protochlamydia sp. R18]|uniref:acyl-CoA desaturase n=1 Tax=Candidatus Protochlamydia sp. R18 TaxID=1353977 RepID=UPI0005A8F880|nr:acyl-CoA desaturase [Candidatus Protochlamydia sp. R18]